MNKQLEAEEIEERGEIDKAKNIGVDVNIILITLQKISSSVFLLDFLANYPRYKFFLFLLWVVFAAAIYSISFAKDEKNKKIPSQTIFLLQCSAVWILLIAFSFLFIMK
jgi:hypothetical protein